MNFSIFSVEKKNLYFYGMGKKVQVGNEQEMAQ